MKVHILNPRFEVRF